MPPARRLKRYRNSKTKTRRKIPWFAMVSVVLGLFAVLLVIGFFIVRPKNYSNNSKLGLVVNGTSNISVYVIDPSEPELTTILIPANTEVEGARDLGKFKLGNIRKLGENEKIGGILLQETVVKNFGFPVTSWADSDAEVLFNGNFFEKLLGVVNKFDTNLTMGDKFKIVLFILRNPRKKEIDISETTFLKKTKFVDGEGFQITKLFPTSLVLVFADNGVAKKQLKVVVKNSSGLSSTNVVPAVIEFSGAKVVSELKEREEDIFCEVKTQEKEFGKKISDVFGCNFKATKAEGNFDVEIRLGKKFLTRF